MTTLLDTPSHAGPRDASRHGRAQPLPLPTVTAGLHALSTWCERVRQRRMLLLLSDAMLRDIGLSRSDALGESGKAFWQA